MKAAYTVAREPAHTVKLKLYITGIKSHHKFHRQSTGEVEYFIIAFRYIIALSLEIRSE